MAQERFQAASKFDLKRLCQERNFALQNGNRRATTLQSLDLWGGS